MSDLKLNKAYEVALTCAAADGLDMGELISVRDSIETVPLLTMVMGEMFGEDELKDYDMVGAIEGMHSVIDSIETAELRSIDDSYMAEATELLGDSIGYNNICIALCIALSSGDGEISGLEKEAIQAVASHLTNLDEDVFYALVDKIMEGIDLDNL
jgi:hypothetical protein